MTKLTEVLEKIDELENYLTERVADLYEVKGGMQARHAYAFYRKMVWEIRELVMDHFNTKEKKK